MVQVDALHNLQLIYKYENNWSQFDSIEQLLFIYLFEKIEQLSLLFLVEDGTTKISYCYSFVEGAYLYFS